jgi:hypothetical protein
VWKAQLLKHQRHDEVPLQHPMSGVGTFGLVPEPGLNLDKRSMPRDVVQTL